MISRSTIEEHAQGLEAIAKQMADDGIGCHLVYGHCTALRQMAGNLRAGALEYFSPNGPWAPKPR
jgi:hypothetical protein